MLAEERKEAEKTNGPNHHHCTFRPIRNGIVVLLSRKIGLLIKFLMTMGEAVIA